MIVCDTGIARTSFAALQARVVAGRRLPAVAAVQPASLARFDVLEHAGTVLRDLPLRQRRAVLELSLAVLHFSIQHVSPSESESTRCPGQYDR